MTKREQEKGSERRAEREMRQRGVERQLGDIRTEREDKGEIEQG